VEERGPRGPFALVSKLRRAHRPAGASDPPAKDTLMKILDLGCLAPSPRFWACLAFAAALAPAAFGQSGWIRGPYLSQTGACPPFVFLTMPTTTNQFGTDAAVDAQRQELDLGAVGKQLMFMDKSLSAPVLLFPAAASYPALGIASTANGTVSEPCVYHDPGADMYWVLFSYAIDVTTTSRDVSKPCELLALNITAAVTNPTGFNLSDLPIVRLTNSAQSATALMQNSFNNRLMGQFGLTPANLVAWPYGINTHFETNTGACVVDEEQGPVLYFASNQRRADGPGLRVGDLKFTASTAQLFNQRTIQHFGTTGLISFFETPGGVGGSYRSSTEADGQWSIFEFRSDEATWQTVSGYANQQNIADHNGTTLAIGPDPSNSLLAISRYYIGNNESFGTIILLPYSSVGGNDDNGGDQISQRGPFSGNQINLFPELSLFQDLGSSLGKFAHPASGRYATSANDVQLFLTYSPGLSHGNTPADYHAKLVVVTNVASQITSSGGTFLPANPPAGYPVQLVLEHPTQHAFAMRPVLRHRERFGYLYRQVLPLKGKADFAGMPTGVADMPVAQVVAGPIYNTDVRPMCRRESVIGSGPAYYDPTTEPRNNTGTDKLAMRVACLTKDIDPAALTAGNVWGVRIFVTDSPVRKLLSPTATAQPHFPGSNWGFLHHNGGGSLPFGDPLAFERFRLLSDVPADSNGMVNFLLPANVPVKFFLLHKDGTVLAAHRNHHSFAPGQLENRCTGCHQHVQAGPPHAFSSSTPFDTLTQTGKYGWNASGTPTFTVVDSPTLEVPEFKRDIWPLLQSECSSCHTNGGSGVAKFDLNMSPIVNTGTGTVTLDQRVAVWSWLNTKRYVNRRLGAAKSPLAWHFAGVASDTAVRLDGETNSRYKGTTSNGQPSAYWITATSGPWGPNPHPGVADKTKAYKVIEWIDAGAAIDHDAVDPSGLPDPSRGVNGDGYQIALNARFASFGSSNLVVGYWDVDANVNSIIVSVRGATHTELVSGNGSFTFDLTQFGLNPPIDENDVVSLDATDTVDNRAHFQKTVRQLLLEAETLRGKVQLTTNGHSFSAGNQIVFTVDAGPAFANSYFYLMMSQSIQPGMNVSAWNVGLWLVQTYDAWLANSFAALRGPLNSNGVGSWTYTVPSGLGSLELYCAAGVLAPGPTMAKSNIEAVKLQ
jgi:Hydrazine synthase alpha subunit middle domain